MSKKTWIQWGTLKLSLPFSKYLFILQNTHKTLEQLKVPYLFCTQLSDCVLCSRDKVHLDMFCIQFGKCTCKIHLPEIGTFESSVRCRCTHHVDLSNKSDWNGSPYFKKCRVKKVFTQSIRWIGVGVRKWYLHYCIS